MRSARDDKDQTVTIAPAVIDATPVTNLDPVDPYAQPPTATQGQEGQNIEHPKNKYDSEGDNNNDGVKKELRSDKADEPLKNSSVALDVYTGTLVFVLATYVFHPAI
jgi:hypothetical protein